MKTLVKIHRTEYSIDIVSESGDVIGREIVTPSDLVEVEWFDEDTHEWKPGFVTVKENDIWCIPAEGDGWPVEIPDLEDTTKYNFWIDKFKDNLPVGISHTA